MTIPRYIILLSQPHMQQPYHICVCARLIKRHPFSQLYISLSCILCFFLKKYKTQKFQFVICYYIFFLFFTKTTQPRFHRVLFSFLQISKNNPKIISTFSRINFETQHHKLLYVTAKNLGLKMLVSVHRLENLFCCSWLFVKINDGLTQIFEDFVEIFILLFMVYIYGIYFFFILSFMKHKGLKRR